MFESTHTTMPTMPTTIETGELADRFEQIRADALECIQRRRELLLTAQAELTAAGINTVVVPSKNGQLGQSGRAFVWESYSTYNPRTTWRRFMTTNVLDDDRWGPYEYDGGVNIARGLFEVIVADAEVALLAQLPNSESEMGHARAVGRLRRKAGVEGMRVRVRGSAVALVSPMGDTVVHEADVDGCFLWLEGVNPEVVEEDTFLGGQFV